MKTSWLTPCVVLLFSLATPVQAALVSYDITYDPTTHKTTLYNHADSQADLLFWTRVGANAARPCGLLPGKTIVCADDGAIWGDDGTWYFWFWSLFNSEAKKDLTIKGKPEDYTVTDCLDNKVTLPIDPKTNLPYIPKGQKYKIKGTGYTLEGCSFAADQGISTTAITDSDAWPVPADQNRIELLAGSLSVSDDTTIWYSVFTPYLVTGCPEPSSLAAFMAVGSLALARRRR